MTSISSPFLCAYCARLIRKGDYDPIRFYCDAYPEGIPPEIVNNDVDHRTEYEGDNGIQYEFAAYLFDEEPKSLYHYLDKNSAQ